MNNRKKAILMDLDGVLAESSAYVHKYLRDIEKKDYTSFWKSIPQHPVNEWAKNLTNIYKSNGYSIVILTARQDNPVARTNTRDWLSNNDIDYDKLLMQPVRDESVMNDLYAHSDIKIAIYNNQIKPYYDIELVVDDNPSNVKMFRGLGLTVLQPNNWWEDNE